MNPSSRPSGLGMTFLVGGLIALLVASLVIAFCPLVKCPGCFGSDEKIIGAGGSWEVRCAYCAGKGVVSVLKKWTLLRNAPAQ
jgi:hypothetical protein